MENPRPPAKTRREEAVAAGSMELEDRISQLPQHILHHILSLLPRKDAVRTCILSKLWCYLVSTRPCIEFYETSFPGNKHEFLSVVENTLQRYDDQKLLIRAFDLEMSAKNDSETISVLDKYIPIVLSKIGLKTFRFSADDFPLPPIVFNSEFLEELFLTGCNLNRIFNSTGKVHALKRLRTLSLKSVTIEEENLEKIFSSCPLIEHLVLDSCRRLSEHFELYRLHNNYFFPRLKSLYLEYVQLPKEWLNNLSSNNYLCLLQTLTLRSVQIEDETFEKIMSICPMIQYLVLKDFRNLSTIKVKMALNLKHFECNGENDYSIEINDAPSLETIRIDECQNWYLNHNSCFFGRLKSLYLRCVHLPTELLNNLSSNNCPCLEELELLHCSGFSEFKLSSYSINRLIIRMPARPIKAVIIDAANMLYFEFVSYYLPSISFSTTSREWKSFIRVWWRSSDFSADVISAWYLKLHEFLKALSQSHISLGISCLPELTNQDNCDGDSYEPVVVEHLCLDVRSAYEVPALLHRAIRICRPRYIGLPLHCDSQERSELAKSIWTTLVEKGETKFWQQDLEETSIQVSDKNTNEWRSVQECALSKNENIRFRLKLRDLS